MSVNAKLPKTRIEEAKNFVFASLIIVAAFTAGAMIYQNGDEMALTPVVPNQATVIQSFEYGSLTY